MDEGIPQGRQDNGRCVENVPLGGGRERMSQMVLEFFKPVKGKAHPYFKRDSMAAADSSCFLSPPR